MSHTTPLAAYEAAIATAKIAGRNLLASFGIGFSEAYDCGEYTALNGNRLLIDAVEVVTGTGWRVGKPTPAEAYDDEYVVATVSKADPAYQNGERVLGRIDSVRLSSNDGAVAYVVGRTDGYDGESTILVILSVDKEVKS
jgi:hypothetical protein